jgi:hypothetical protein
MLTSLMSKGMYCSASQRIVSSSSSLLCAGSEIRFTITEWPETEVTTSLDLKPPIAQASAIAAEMAGAFMNEPCTIASGGSGAKPKPRNR